MVSSCRVLALSAILSLISAHAPELGKRAPLKAFGIEKNGDGFGGEALAEDEYQAGFAPLPQLGKKNATMPQLQDRSLELVDRQSCAAGYWYCPAFARCCPRTSLCCSYGYCIDPADTCCPDAPCDPGWNCCGANCSPRGGDCCSDGHYCDAGNICVKLFSNGRIVCCTDLKCTAHVVSGTTSYISTTSPAVEPPSITAPPQTTQVVTVGDSYTTYYWTVTWWYLSFYWSTYRTESTVTYTRIYETTTYTTTATDVIEASSLFSELSESLTFTPPSDAQTSLASLLNVQPSETAESSFSFDNLSTTRPSAPEETTSSSSSSPSSSSSSSSSTTTEESISTGLSTTASPSGPSGGGSGASSVLVQWVLMGLGAMSGILMIWL